MRNLILLATLLCATVLAIVSPALAQNVLWVSATGNDANACSTTAPCATFQGAINKGSVSQINCLNSGNYGPVTLTASITIDCGTGNIGNVAVSSDTAITIGAASAATIVLRHLSINGLGTAAYGIVTQAFSSGTLIVEDCAIYGFRGGYGALFAPSGGRGLLQVSNSRIFDNSFGILVAPTVGRIASVTLDKVELAANSHAGLLLSGTGIIAGTMRDSVASGNGTYGVYTDAGQVYFTVEESSLIANLTTGVQTASAGSVVNVGASTLGGNGTGVGSSAGQIISFGNNQMGANGTNGSFTSTTTLR